MGQAAYGMKLLRIGFLSLLAAGLLVVAVLRGPVTA
jgi:hypothetical protein